MKESTHCSPSSSKDHCDLAKGVLREHLPLIENTQDKGCSKPFTKKALVEGLARSKDTNANRLENQIYDLSVLKVG